MPRREVDRLAEVLGRWGIGLHDARSATALHLLAVRPEQDDVAAHLGLDRANAWHCLELGKVRQWYAAAAVLLAANLDIDALRDVGEDAIEGVAEGVGEHEGTGNECRTQDDRKHRQSKANLVCSQIAYGDAAHRRRG